MKINFIWPKWLGAKSNDPRIGFSINDNFGIVLTPSSLSFNTRNTVKFMGFRCYCQTDMYLRFLVSGYIRSKGLELSLFWSGRKWERITGHFLKFQWYYWWPLSSKLERLFKRGKQK